MTKKNFSLRIYHDSLTEGASATLPKARRIIYCVAGQAAISAAGRNETLTDDMAWFSNEECTIQGEVEGARLWRWELAGPDDSPGEICEPAIKSVQAREYGVELDTSIERLMRLDQVSFPPGGEALTHVHAAPGVRCLIKGNLLLETQGHRFRVWPGDSWAEQGPDEVYARASEKEPTAFVRVMIVPNEYRGRSTITYVREEDKDKPKSQNYKRYLEEPIAL